MPEDLLDRAQEILDGYEKGEIKKIKASDNRQLSMVFDEPKEDKLRDKLKTIDPLHITPMEALNLLFELKEIE